MVTPKLRFKGCVGTKIKSLGASVLSRDNSVSLQWHKKHKYIWGTASGVVQCHSARGKGKLDYQH